MDTERIHRAISNDGTQIVGRVRGHGPPLVLLHAGLGDGDLDCGGLAAYLEDRFTCYLPSTRNRGLSGRSADLSLRRHVEDVVAFVESVGEPVGLLAHSGGAISLLGAVERTSAVSAVALYEPLALEALGEAGAARVQAAVHRMAELADEGRLVDAARGWMTDYADDEEMAALAASGWLEAGAQYVPVLLGQLSGLTESDETSPTEPSELARISVPVLVLHGSRTRGAWLVDSVRHVSDHLPDVRVREVAGAGHSGMIVAPEPVAEELVRFFASSRDRV